MHGKSEPHGRLQCTVICPECRLPMAPLRVSDSGFVLCGRCYHRFHVERQGLTRFRQDDSPLIPAGLGWPMIIILALAMTAVATVTFVTALFSS